ncbi:MAG TPA: hypothetical protein VKB71_16260 [Rhizomicrobium sp.]|nr:hypothetical protein [Rhizomicrobium sp.]
MSASRQIPSSERILDLMIDLARAARSHRVIVAGSGAFDAYLSLLDRGFLHAATTMTCRVPRGQHDVSFIVGRHSTQALENLLVRVVPFLNARAALAVSVDAGANHPGTRLHVALERLGFRIEAGSSCGSGFVLSAGRRGWREIGKVA